MGYEEERAIEETREKVKVAVQQRELTNENEEEIPEEIIDPEIWTMPRRWYVYK